MKYVQLRAFHHVALHGGFSAAARALGLTQPAVSDQVLALEQTHDVLLFERHQKRVTLTPQGEKLFAITRPMFEYLTRAQELLAETRALASGELRIIADSAYHVTGVLSRFRARYPGVHVTLRAGNSQAVEAELAAWRADIGVLGSTVAQGRFQTVHLGTSPIIAFAARGFSPMPASPARLRDLAALPLVFRERGSKTRQKLEASARAQSIPLRPAIEAEGREAVREIVAAGGGIGFVSEAEYGRDERLVKIAILGPPIPMEETVVCMAQRSEVRAIRAFMAMARESAPPAPGRGGGAFE